MIFGHAEVRRAILGFGAYILVKYAIFSAILYVAFHFINKFW